MNNLWIAVSVICILCFICATVVGIYMIGYNDGLNSLGNKLKTLEKRIQANDKKMADVREMAGGMIYENLTKHPLGHPN